MAAKNIIIIPVCNNAEHISQSIPLLDQLNREDDGNQFDILIIDDGSTDNTFELIEDISWLKYFKHDIDLGFGASFLTGYKYARDFDYEVMITVDLINTDLTEDIKELMENINYGYDLVSCSRILENYNHPKFKKILIDITTELSSHLEEIINENITDPLSEIKALRVSSMENLELTEFSHGLLLELWIQSSYFGLNIIEIPAFSVDYFGNEFVGEEDPLGFYLSIIETEKHLYKKGNIN